MFVYVRRRSPGSQICRRASATGCLCSARSAHVAVAVAVAEALSREVWKVMVDAEGREMSEFADWWLSLELTMGACLCVWDPNLRRLFNSGDATRTLD